MTKKQKLELTWIGKENRPRLEPRILLEDPEKSHHAKHRVREPEFETAEGLTAENAKSAKKQNAHERHQSIVRPSAADGV